jgi:hypothetical protein
MMSKIVLRAVALIGLSFFCFASLAYAQSQPSQQGSAQQTKVSDKELRAFAKAYVEYHKIRQRYEPTLNNVKDPTVKEKLQQEGNTKVKEAVEKQGLTVDRYNKIFATVNANEELRKKALKLINEERKKS